jgi:protein phosphatase
MRPASPSQVEIPDFALVVLIGATGAGKSTFAKRWFSPAEVVSSDACRGLIADDPNDQSVSSDAFEVVRLIVEKRLKGRRLAVVDATNVRAADRKPWIEIARRWHALPVAIVLDPGLDVCVTRNKARPDRDFGPGVPKRMIEEIRRGLHKLPGEGFRQIWRLSSAEAIEAAVIERRPLWTDKRGDHGPFDIVGDVHGCADELIALLEKLGYRVELAEGAARVAHPEGRKLVFAGDLVDRGPRTPDVLRIAMAAVASGAGYAVQGNHDHKLARQMAGRKVTAGHGLQASIDQLAAETPEFREEVKAFLDGLRSHYWLDGGRLAVAHAGLKEEMIGRGSSAVREFALYGETTGESDAMGAPARLDWAAGYRGAATVVYGHTTVPKVEFVNNTVCVDTGCVFGGQLSALRWPEREIVAVDASRVYVEPKRPAAPAAIAPTAQARADHLLDHADIAGDRWITTALTPKMRIGASQNAAALEAMTRFAIAPQWLIYLPPTMSPVETSSREGWLERPEEAFAFYRERGVTELALEEKHMGSRAVIAVCRDESVARARFGAAAEAPGAIWTRTGRAFFSGRATSEALLERLRHAAEASGIWEELATDWLLWDAEIMPWSAKASSLIEQQYEPVAAAARAGLSAALEAARRAAARGVPVQPMADRLTARLGKAESYAEAWRPYSWPVRSVDDLKVAPFHLLASEGAVHFDKDHAWHMAMAARLAEAGGAAFAATRWRRLDVSDAEACAQACDWWEDLTARGGEGMVVKPLGFVSRGAKGLIQPALKVRGSEYLRIIYGPEYDMPDNLARLRTRGLGHKRALALREFALGHEALTRFAARAPLRKVHECVFAILAMESEPIDPRL